MAYDSTETVESAMKHIITTSLFLLALAAPAIAFESGGDSNYIDETGQRQGYWTINGFMSNDRSYAPDETVEEGVYEDNRREGIWKKYWPGGKLRSQIAYQDGKPHGTYSLYYDNGLLEEAGNWINNRNTDEFSRYHKNGQAQQRFNFTESGKRNGMQRYYHENGKLQMEVNLVLGQEQGICRRYNEEGDVIEEKTFEKGIMVPGTLITYEDAPTKKPVITADPYDKQVGKPSIAVTDLPNAADSFKANGFNTLYNKTGDITQTGEFVKGKLHNGKWYKYNTDGLLIRVEIYKSGRFVGTGVISEADL